MINFLLAFILSISCIVAADSEDIVETTNTRNSHVTMLDLSNDQTLTDISFLKYFPNLRELDLRESYNILNIEFLGQLTRLEKLNISGVFFEDYTGCSDLSFLAPLVELKELDISGNFNLFYISPLTSLPNLHVLDLGLCSNIRDIKSLVGFPALKQLITTRGKPLGLPKLPGVKITPRDYHLS